MSKNNPLKRTLTLDLNTSMGSKKARVQQLQHSQILTSPDVQMLKLTTPELADFLTRNPTLATPTPSGLPYLPKTVTEEQELYAKGFEEALKNLHNSSTGPTDVVVTSVMEAGSTTISVTPATSIMTIEKATAAYRNKLTGSGKQQFLTVPASVPQATSTATTQQLPVNPILPPRVITALSSAPTTAAGSGSELSRPSSGASGSLDSSMDSPYSYNQIHIKEEMDYDNTSNDSSIITATRKSGGRRRTTSSPAPASSLMSPINLESQEKIKLERKRLRNRLAASKCRKRKLERISQLDSKVSELKDENAQLAACVKKLKDAVYNLKQQVLEHAKHGCQINPL